MLNKKVLAQSILASFALLTLSQTPKASALPNNWVQSGPHGAIQVIDGDHPPTGTRALPTAASHAFPKVTIRGSHGAGQIATHDKMEHKMSEGQSSEKSKEMMRFQSKSKSNVPTYQSTNRRSAEELLEITNPLI